LASGDKKSKSRAKATKTLLGISFCEFCHILREIYQKSPHSDTPCTHGARQYTTKQDFEKKKITTHQGQLPFNAN
jgi:hypothetical protein